MFPSVTLDMPCDVFQIRFRDVAPKLVQLLTEWTETFPYDFRDERMMRSLKEMTHHVARGDEVSVKSTVVVVVVSLHGTQLVTILIWKITSEMNQTENTCTADHLPKSACQHPSQKWLP